MLAGQLPAAPGARWLLILTCAGVSLLRQQQGELIDWCVLADHAGATHWASRLPLQLAREAARRGDACRAVEIIDCEAATDLPLLRQALLDAGWASRVGAPDPFTHWVWRLVSATLTASAV